MGVRFGSKAASPTAVTRDATQLGGTAAAEFEALAIDLSGIVFWSGLLERYLGRARAELAEDAATAAWEEGRRTRFEHAIALALDARGPGAERALWRTLSESHRGHMQLKGFCDCGAVKFRLQSDSPVPFMHCYCTTMHFAARTWDLNVSPRG